MDFILSNSLQTTLVLVFIAVVLAVEAGVLWWRGRHGGEARRRRQRLRGLAGRGAASVSAVKGGGAREPSPLEQRLRALPRLQPLQRVLLESGLGWSLARLLGTCAAVALAAAAVLRLWVWMPLMPALAGGLAAASLPLAYVAFWRGRRLRRVEAQLPEALDLIGRAMRAGHGFTAALQMAGDEAPEPLAGELRMAHDEISFGVSLEQALGSLGERLPLTDVRYFVVSVLIQRDSGGNLTEVLAKLAALIRERQKLQGKVRVLSANGRFSAWVLVVMPFALGALMNVFNPAFMSPLWTDPMGLVMLKGMALLMVVGIFIMRRIVRIRV